MISRYQLSVCMYVCMYEQDDTPKQDKPPSHLTLIESEVRTDRALSTYLPIHHTYLLATPIHLPSYPPYLHTYLPIYQDWAISTQTLNLNKSNGEKAEGEGEEVSRPPSASSDDVITSTTVVVAPTSMVRGKRSMTMPTTPTSLVSSSSVADRLRSLSNSLGR